MTGKKSPYERSAESKERWAAIPAQKRNTMTPEEIATVREIPLDVFVNAGTASIIVPKRGEDGQGQSVRLDPGDWVQGDYYEQCLKLARGLMRMCLVDDERLDTLAKQKRIRDKEEYPDWVKEAKSKLGTRPDTTKSSTDAFMGEDPTDRLLRAQAEARPHAADEKKGR